ncbi:MAG TPA: hypothetical protein VK699_03565 [Terriglobales bacterium]|nr:hypothetical protein [Terriglobales bacterium]
MIKKQLVFALLLLLLIPVVSMLGGMLFNLIDPEIAAGHPNYARNYHLLSVLRIVVWLASGAVAAVVWLLACFLVIRSKQRSPLWLLLAAFGPFGFAVLAMLNDRAPAETDRYARFVRNLNKFAFAGYELCSFVILWLLAYEAMVLMRNLIIVGQSVTTGMSTAQIIQIQNASGGMWAFGEAIEVIYIVILLYLLRPIVFNLLGRLAASMAAPTGS